MDRVYCKLVHQDMSYKGDFDPASSVTKILDLPGKPGSLAVIVPPWHANKKILERRAYYEQRRNGNAVLAFLIDDNVLSSNVDRTLASMAVIASFIAKKVQDRKPKKFHAIATSLGSVPLLQAVGEHDLQPDTLNLVVPGGSLAKSLWTGYRRQALRAQFEAQGITLPDLENSWRVLSPTFQAARVHGANVQITVSSADEIILPGTAHELATSFKNAGNNVTLRSLPGLGHYGSIVVDALQHWR